MARAMASASAPRPDPSAKAIDTRVLEQPRVRRSRVRAVVGCRAMREAAQERGEVLLPPLLILGTSERVGSNWISDTLRPLLGQHNEPFRQQLGPGHPLSPLNPRSGGPG